MRLKQYTISHVRGFGAFICIIICSQHTLWSLGYRVPNQDAEAIARGNAFVATADNPSAVYYNPAGITQLEGHQFSFGSYNVYLNSQHKSSTTGASPETDFGIVPVPHFYYTYNPESLPVAFGVGVNNGFGLQLSWPEDSGFRTFVTEALLQHVSVNPVVAWEVTKGLSIAMGPTINYSQIQLKSGVFPNGTSSADELSFDGNGFDFGFSAGLLWQPVPEWSFGFNYRSGTKVKHKGDLFLRPISPVEDSQAEVRFPSTFALGISYRPTPKWNVEFDLEYTNWDEIRNVTLTRDVPGTSSLVVPFEYKSGFMYKFGLSYYFDNGITLSGGYFYTENNVKDVNFNPAVPDTPLHAFSIGGSYERKNWTYALSYQFITGDTTVTGSTPSAAGQSVDGDYEYTFHTITASIGYKF